MINFRNFGKWANDGVRSIGQKIVAYAIMNEQKKLLEKALEPLKETIKEITTNDGIKDPKKLTYRLDGQMSGKYPLEWSTVSLKPDVDVHKAIPALENKYGCDEDL